MLPDLKMERAHAHGSLGQFGRPADLHLETLPSALNGGRTGLLPQKTSPAGQGRKRITRNL